MTITNRLHALSYLKTMMTKGLCFLQITKAEKAATFAMRRIGEGAKKQLRRDAVSAGWSRKAANSFRYETYPKGTTSLSPAAVIYSKAPHLAEVFNEGKTIRSSKGFWMAIPTENAPKKVNRKRINPSNFPEQRLGKLRFVAVPGRKDLGMLVVDKLRKSKAKRGGYGKASKAALKRGDFENSVPMFWLKKQVRMRKELNSHLIVSKWNKRLGAMIDQEFRKLDAMDGDR